MSGAKWYEVTLTQTFLVKTEDIAGTMNLHKFSTFPDLDPDTEVKFQDGEETYREVFICNCGEDCGCDTQVNTEGQDCDDCFIAREIEANCLQLGHNIGFPCEKCEIAAAIARGSK